MASKLTVRFLFYDDVLGVKMFDVLGDDVLAVKRAFIYSSSCIKNFSTNL